MMPNFECKGKKPGFDRKGMDFRPKKFRHDFDGHHGFMFRKNGKFDICRYLIPRGPMNEDEMAKFATLKMDLRDAMQDYRAENSEANMTALKSSVDKLVTAALQYEIERCEKALARAKAAVARKDKIVERTVKKITAFPRPGEGRPHPGHPRAVK